MPRRRIGQESFGFDALGRRASLDALRDLIDWSRPEALLGEVYPAERGEAAWPPLALFRALLLAVWHDLSDVRLAEALDNRSSFPRFCGFSRFEPTPERTAFVRFRSELVARGLDRALFEAVTDQLRAKAVTVKTGRRSPRAGSRGWRRRPRACRPCEGARPARHPGSLARPAPTGCRLGQPSAHRHECRSKGVDSNTP